MLLDYIAILLNLLGGLAFAKGLFISNKEALELGVSRWSGTDEENMKLPAVQDRVRQRKWGIFGAILLVLSSILQLISLNPSLPINTLNLLQTTGLTHINVGISEVIAIGALFVSILAYQKSKDKFFTKENIDLLGYQAVFLTNDQVYFGKITEVDKDFIKLEYIYYLQDPNDQVNVTLQNLVKLGNELHSPEDVMYILRAHIIFWEKLKENGSVVNAIREYENSKIEI